MLLEAAATYKFEPCEVYKGRCSAIMSQKATVHVPDTSMDEADPGMSAGDPPTDRNPEGLLEQLSIPGRSHRELRLARGCHDGGNVRGEMRHVVVGIQPLRERSAPGAISRIASTA